MAKIVHSKAAPSDESVLYTFVGEGFTLKGSESYETTDPVVIGAALAHPWLEVDYGKVEVISGLYREQLAPKDDIMSAVNSKANDPEAVRAHLEAQAAEAVEAAPLAVEAGRDQDRKTKVDGVAQTLAADPADKASTTEKKDKS